MNYPTCVSTSAHLLVYTPIYPSSSPKSALNASHIFRHSFHLHHGSEFKFLHSLSRRFHLHPHWRPRHSKKNNLSSSSVTDASRDIPTSVTVLWPYSLTDFIYMALFTLLSFLLSSLFRYLVASYCIPTFHVHPHWPPESKTPTSASVIEKCQLVPSSLTRLCLCRFTALIFLTLSTL